MASKSSSSSRTCLCAPTTHPGSFRCSLHRSFCKLAGRPPARTNGGRLEPKLDYSSKTNLLKASLMKIIKPSSHDIQRRRNFQPRPSRFCLMNSNSDGVAVS
ncbi:uncharacterized protein LOC131158532 [Malania oleifera]|uniref:uncharacterized protein LOC131158532 n=1 Tax=Malania oleifera TaxID=397392 RepID=UPI0025AE6CD2|nr:uncharacterized protein LOC131158532 [Malania oleifera]